MAQILAIDEITDLLFSDIYQFISVSLEVEEGEIQSIGICMMYSSASGTFRSTLRHYRIKESAQVKYPEEGETVNGGGLYEEGAEWVNFYVLQHWLKQTLSQPGVILVGYDLEFCLYYLDLMQVPYNQCSGHINIIDLWEDWEDGRGNLVELLQRLNVPYRGLNNAANRAHYILCALISIIYYYDSTTDDDDEAAATD